MGGFFMLLKIIFIRLVPILCLGYLKDQKHRKRAAGLLCLIYCEVFVLASTRILEQKGWNGIWYLLLSMFPQGIFYMGSVWLILQCLWNMWSQRVWKRIYYLSIFVVILGIFTENYINPQILQIFFKNFK